MAKYDKISPETQQEAMKIARANQKPGQTKEQTPAKPFNSRTGRKIVSDFFPT